MTKMTEGFYSIYGQLKVKKPSYGVMISLRISAGFTIVVTTIIQAFPFPLV